MRHCSSGNGFVSDYIGLCSNSESLSPVYVLITSRIHSSKSVRAFGKGKRPPRPETSLVRVARAALERTKRENEAAPQKIT
jgi:hypothetical protein